MKNQLYEQYPLLPLKSNKAPAIKNWGLDIRCTKDSILNSEYIGFMCGFEQIEVIDIDNHFGDADSLFSHVYNNIDISKFPIVKTKGGGYHIYIRSEKARGNLKLASRKVIENDESKHIIDDKGNHRIITHADYSIQLVQRDGNWEGISTLIETRGVGGYVVCPPSPGYEIIQGDIFDITLISEIERGSIICTCQSLDELKHDSETNTAIKNTSDIRPGDSYNNDESNVEVTKSILRNFGWSSDNNGKHWTRPGKEKKDGISATFGKVGDNKLYVFSSNAYPFESGCSYSMFSVKAILEFNGDYKACAKSIAPQQPQQKKQKQEDKKGIDLSEDEVNQYLRIGDNYYKNINYFDIHGNKVEKISRRQRQTLIDDFGKSFLSTVKQFDDFVNVPSHYKYNRQVGNCYNMYQEVNLEFKEGDFPTIKKFMGHIFGTGKRLHKDKEYDEVEIGYDYIQLLLKDPTHILPILCLVSEENQTGKTTFGNFLNCIFGGNFVSIGQNELVSEFNGSYSSSLVCMIDESWIKYSVIDKLKYMSTNNNIMLRQMHRDHTKIGFFCKFILCSNRTKDFIVANDTDIRYWVRELKKFEGFDPDFLDRLKSEIPQFLYFLDKREMHTPEESRQYFHENLIKTDALDNVIKNSKDMATKDFIEYVLEVMEEHGMEELDCTLKDLKEQFFDRRVDITTSKIKEILKDNLKLEQRSQPSYYQFLDSPKGKNGRFFTIPLSLLKKYLNVNYEGVIKPQVFGNIPESYRPSEEICQF